jgi:hypothetical protein
VGTAIPSGPQSSHQQVDDRREVGLGPRLLPLAGAEKDRLCFDYEIQSGGTPL